jgi:hypothetical protein
MVRTLSRLMALPVCVEARLDVPIAAARSVSVVAVWLDAVRTLSTHAAPILTCACLGLAVPGALGAVISLIQNGHQLPLPAPCPFHALPEWPWLVPMLAAALLTPLAQGVIARMALHGADQRCGLRAAFALALARWPALALGGVAYGTLTAAAFVLLAPGLSGVGLDPRGVRAAIWPARPLGGLVREITVRGANALLPDPGPIYCGVAGVTWVNPVRPNDRPLGDDGSARGLVNLGLPYSPTPVQPTAPTGARDVPPSWLVTLCSLAALTIGEILLRFRAVSAVLFTGSSPFRVLAEGIRVAGRHIGIVTGHVWLVQLALTGTYVLLVGLPVTLVRQLVYPVIARTPELAPAQLVGALLLVSLALVESVYLAFSVVYDARLFIALKRAEQGK